MTRSPIRILIADDHPAILRGLKHILADDPAIEIVGEAHHFPDVLKRLQTTAVDLLVLDLGGMEALPLSMIVQLREEYPKIRCVIYSSSVDLAPEVRREGVLGYVVKEEMESHLLAAIHAAVAGNWYASPIVQEYLDHSEEVGGEFFITPRELTTLKLLAQGKSTEAIAKEMGFSKRAAQNNISQLYAKTGCTERTQLAEWQ